MGGRSGWAREDPLGCGGLLTELERGRIDAWLRVRVLREGAGGQIALCPTLLQGVLSGGSSVLQRRYKPWGLVVREVVWGWVAQLGDAGVEAGGVERLGGGGHRRSGWKLRSQVEGRWRGSLTVSEELCCRREGFLACLPLCERVHPAEGGGWVLDAGALSEIYNVHLVKSYLDRDLFYCDVALLCSEGLVAGNCRRMGVGIRRALEGWWSALGVAEHLLEVYPYKELQVVVALLKSWENDNNGQVGFIVSARALVSGQPKGRVLWVLDLCSGYQSRRSAVIGFLRQHCRDYLGVRYIGLDVLATVEAGELSVQTDLVVSLLDFDLLPKGEMLAAICSQVGLHGSWLVHIFGSTPCETNSLCSVTNNSASRSEASGYRDWNLAGHPALPAVAAGVVPGVGYTRSSKRRLALDHDRLERRVISDLECECPAFGISYSLENPWGSLYYKKHTRKYRDGIGARRVVEVNHCAYGGWYMKHSLYLTDLGPSCWEPHGLTLDGRCGGTGARTGVSCAVGAIGEKGRWCHTYSIGQESGRELVPGVHREVAKNSVPCLQTVEILHAAWGRWAGDGSAVGGGKRVR
jgi:hypothetical protein